MTMNSQPAMKIGLKEQMTRATGRNVGPAQSEDSMCLVTALGGRSTAPLAPGWDLFMSGFIRLHLLIYVCA